MAGIILKSILMGVAGFVAAPIVTFFIVLILAHIFDPRCGTPGDSGGCEMGAAGIAIASALPGAAALFLVALIRGLVARRRAAEPPLPPTAA
ncbi:MAG: hypothetical protein WDZ83_14810 [Rhizobiaceae bacterium]